MKFKTVLIALAIVAMTVAAVPASWASLTVDGITFSFSTSGSDLLLTISGTGTGGYTGVNNIEAIALGKGTYGTATLGTTAAVSTGTTFSADGNNLTATGCQTVSGTSFGTCFSGSTTYSAAGVTFTFTNTGSGSFNASGVDLKACFSVGGEFCAGSLVSAVVPGAGVPEPASLMLLGAGLAGIGIWRRKAIKA